MDELAAFGNSSSRDDWLEVDAAPPLVAELAEQVEDAQRPGRFFEFAEGCLYEVLLARVGQVPLTRVAARLDARDLPSLVESLSEITASVASLQLAR